MLRFDISRPSEQMIGIMEFHDVLTVPVHSDLTRRRVR
jgi:hypothetical protein